MLVRPESASDSRRRVKHVVTVVRYDEGGGGGGGGVGVGGETCKELDVDAVTVESTKVAVARTAKDDVMWKQADDKSKCKETFLWKEVDKYHKFLCTKYSHDHIT